MFNFRNHNNFTYFQIKKMGTWVLEVARMAMYMSFPVACFYYFNQPEYFEEWVTKVRRELYPPENKTSRDEIQNAIKKMKDKYDQEMLKAMNESLEE